MEALDLHVQALQTAFHPGRPVVRYYPYVQMLVPQSLFFLTR